MLAYCALSRMLHRAVLAALLWAPVLLWPPAPGAQPLLNEATVVLDPGHGGTDPGAIGISGVKEKDLELDVAGRVRRRLQASNIRTRLTRSGDQTVSLRDRSTRARSWGAGLFVSIHANSAANAAARGAESYILPAHGFASTSGSASRWSTCDGNAFDAANMLLAFHTHKGMVLNTGADDRGIRRARFQVLREANCPAVLVECGFLSNRAEERRLRESAYREKLAEGITQGILTMIGQTTRY